MTRVPVLTLTPSAPPCKRRREEGLYNTALEVMVGLSGYHTAVRCDAPTCCTVADALLALPRIEVAEHTDLAALLPAAVPAKLASLVAA